MDFPIPKAMFRLVLMIPHCDDIPLSIFASLLLPVPHHLCQSEVATNDIYNQQLTNYYDWVVLISSDVFDNITHNLNKAFILKGVLRSYSRLYIYVTSVLCPLSTNKDHS